MRRQIRVVAAMIEEEGRYLITQRRPKASLPLLWEFPGGRVEGGESDQQALVRELDEEMAIDVVVEEIEVSVDHSYPDYDIEFRVYRARRVGGEIQHLGVHDHRWVLPHELDQYDFPGVDERSVAMLIEKDA